MRTSYILINFIKKKKKKKKKSDDDDVGFESDKHRYVEFYSTIKKIHWKSAGRHNVPFRHIIVSLGQPVIAFSPYRQILSGEAANTNFIVLCLARTHDLQHSRQARLINNKKIYCNSYSKTCILRTNFCVRNRQVFQFTGVKLTKISYIGTLFKVQLIQDFVLFKILFRQDSLYIQSKANRIKSKMITKYCNVYNQKLTKN